MSSACLQGRLVGRIHIASTNTTPVEADCVLPLHPEVRGEGINVVLVACSVCISVRRARIFCCFHTIAILVLNTPVKHLSTIGVFRHEFGTTFHCLLHAGAATSSSKAASILTKIAHFRNNCHGSLRFGWRKRTHIEFFVICWGTRQLIGLDVVVVPEPVLDIESNFLIIFETDASVWPSYPLHVVSHWFTWIEHKYVIGTSPPSLCIHTQAWIRLEPNAVV